MIRTLQVDGYRLLDDFEADLGQLTVVIGANATGKSTLLDCLQFIARCAEYPLEDALGWSGGFYSLANAAAQTDKIGWQLTFAKPSLTSEWMQLPLSDNRVYTYEVTLSGDPSGQATPVYEVLRTAEALGDHAQPLKFLEATPHRSMIFDPRQSKLVQFDTAVPGSEHAAGHGRTAPPTLGRGAPAIAAPSGKTALRLSQMRFVNEYPEPSWIRYMLASCTFYPGFEVGQQSALRTRPAEIRAESQLWPTGDNLGMVLHEILTRDDYRDSADVLRGFLRSAYPSFEEISPETARSAPGKVVVRLRESGMQRAMGLWELSDGMVGRVLNVVEI